MLRILAAPMSDATPSEMLPRWVSKNVTTCIPPSVNFCSAGMEGSAICPVIFIVNKLYL